MKTRMCPDCGSRELDKYQKKCAECREATRQHCQSLAEYRYRQTQKYKDSLKTERHRKYMREYMARRRAELNKDRVV